ncbi:MAG: agmatine deiminase family protein [Planctomycetes bacterium]|nr:agmatine deiminase family protein [Planctomycetota bacterium]
MRTLIWATSLALLGASAVCAGDFLSANENNWWRYTNQTTQQQVTTRIALTSGNWRRFENFAGLGDHWLYIFPDNEWTAVFDGAGGYTWIPAFDSAVGTREVVQFGGVNDGEVRVVERGATVTTAAGTFNDVTRLALRPTAGTADAGVTSIWIAKGAGVVKWAEQSFMGEQVYELTAAMVDGGMLPAQPSQPTTPASPAGQVAPTEHADQELILWGCNDPYIVIPTYRDAWRAMHAVRARSECAVDSNQSAAQIRAEMVQAGVSLDYVDFLLVDLETVWMRDYGPIITKDAATGERQIVDPQYYPGRPYDDRFPRAYAADRGWARVSLNLSFEGGNFVTDGRGTVMVSKGVQWFNRSRSVSYIEREFEKVGANRVVFFEPLVDEGTTHMDMFSRIMDDDTALVSRYPAGHKQAAVCDQAAAGFRSLGYRVLRVDADYRYDEYGTYTNSVLINGLALVPNYSDGTKNRAALQVYRDAGYDAQPVDARLIIRYSGATHCVSMQVPR